MRPTLLQLKPGWRPLLALVAGGGLVGAASAAAKGPAAASPAPVSRAADEFFESRVRPLLVEQCSSCHGPKLQQSGLRVDSLPALLKGGQRGPSVVPGKPDASLLIRSLRHSGPLKMPPAGKLQDEQIQTLSEWVRMGAPWPAPARPAGASARAGADPKRHWAFQPVRRPALPRVKNRTWVRTPIDAFVLAKLEAKGLSPAPPADPRTLIRRAYFDLLGLSPAAGEVEAFVKECAAESARAGAPSPNAQPFTPRTSPRPNAHRLPPNAHRPPPDAYSRLIDRLLADPRYGERWGRYWLDLARYADTKGYVYTGERRYPFSYTYRDYVIRAFNEDLPYDRFLREQLAADQLPGTGDRRSLAALGFLTLGRRFVNMQPDIIDDRIDVVFRSTQGLTVSCARCHDHKYDPIPTADYYSLYGVFAGSTEKTVPIAGPVESAGDRAAYEAELKKRQEAFDRALESRTAELSERVRTRIADYLAMVPRAERLPGEEFYVIMGPDDINPILVRNWRAYVDRFRTGLHPVWGPWHALERLPEEEFAARAPAIAREFAANAGGRLNPRVARLFAEEAPKSMEEVARRYGGLLGEVLQAWRSAVKAATAAGTPVPTALPDPADEALRQVLFAVDSPASIPKLRISEVEYYFDEKTRNELNELQAKVDQWYIQSPATPPHALVLEDLPVLHDPRIFLRGNPSTKGAVVPRQFLAVLTGPARRPFRKGSGRLELAEAIASPKNPLTARVMVNRVWLGHFGRGLVDTPSDFGLRGERPSHPELLDWLAAWFTGSGTASKQYGSMGVWEYGSGKRYGSVGVWEYGSKNASPTAFPTSPRRRTSGRSSRGFNRLANTAPNHPHTPTLPHPHTAPPGAAWSVKKLHRLIMLSSTYRQSSVGVAKTVQADPQNRLLGRMSRRRLDFEALRDSLLFAAGRLDPAMGGPSVDLFRQPFSRRRSVYALIDRQNLPGLLRVFDFANPDRHSPQRHATTSPQQALFMLNSPFVAEQAQALLERPEVAEARGIPERIRALYRLVYGRVPRPAELTLAQEFLGAPDAEPAPSPAWEYGWGEVRESADRISGFHPFPHFTGEAWQGGPAWPDPATGWARLTAAGGHPGNDAAHAVVRRWTAPADGVATVSGKLVHGTKEGDGVRARLFSSRAGLLGTWTAHNGSAETRVESIEVRKGDMLDFVVDCRGSISHDDFQWAPVVRTRGAADSATGQVSSWDAGRDFAGPALTAWQQYAQSLLLANEFIFVD